MNLPRRKRSGVEGERAVARTLNKKVKGKHVLLHNRTHRNRRGDIDHIAITPAGVWVIDTKKDMRGRLKWSARSSTKKS